MASDLTEPFTATWKSTYWLHASGWAEMKITPICCAAALLLSGCVSKAVDVSESGVRPDLAARGLVVAPAAEPASGSVGPVTARLAAAGLTGREAAGRPYLVELSYSQRPLTVGAYAGEPPAEPEAWVAPPSKQRWWMPRRVQLCTLSARVVDPALGGEAYSVKASTRGRGPECGREPAEMAAAVASKLAPAP